MRPLGESGKIGMSFINQETPERQTSGLVVNGQPPAIDLSIAGS